jgi:hypothetical protein
MTTQTPTVMLTGPAVHGLVTDRLHMRAVADLPVEVKLGCQLRPGRHMAAVQLEHFVTSLKAVPPSTNWRKKAAASLARMYRNNVQGCCVISGKAHKLGLVSANDADSGGEVQATDAEIDRYYAMWKAGRGDSGCVISDVLDHMRNEGMTLGGKTYKIDGYVAVNNRNVELAKAAIVIFGSLTLGLDLPGAWTNSDVWDVTGTRSVGGHDVEAVDYDDQFLYIASWGRVYRMTWAAFTSSRYVTECYATLAPLWYGTDKLAPSGFDVARLQQALQLLGGGTVPDVDPPTPTPPGPGPQPVPPGPQPARMVVVVPDQQVYTGTFPFGRTVTVVGGTYPVVPAAASAAAAGPGRRTRLGDLIDLIRKIGPLLRDAGPLVADLRELVADVQAGKLGDLPGDVTAILADIQRIASDLGILPAADQNAAFRADKVFVGFPESRRAA